MSVMTRVEITKCRQSDKASETYTHDTRFNVLKCINLNCLIFFNLLCIRSLIGLAGRGQRSTCLDFKELYKVVFSLIIFLIKDFQRHSSRDKVYQSLLHPPFILLYVLHSCHIISYFNL